MKLGPAILALTFATAPALAGEVSPAPGEVSLNGASDGPAWFANVSGVKLVAVDGSTLSLAPTEGGLSFALTSQDGTALKSYFAFLSDNLGTISDDADAGHVNGFFRETDNGFEAQFADGRTESLVANIAGGLTLTLRNGAESTCTSWYPPDHAFSAAERRAALAAYVDRLGLGDKSKKAAPHVAPICVPAIRIVKNNMSPGAAQPLVVVTHPQADTALKTAISAQAENAARISSPTGLIPVVVRSSPVHLIDGAAASLPEPALAKTPAPGASGIMAMAPTATVSKVPAGSGASDCLSVDSDGANLGFRNHCAYGVQFAYCLQRAGDVAANCDAGSKTGAVSANGFAAVLLDTNIKTADAEHDFRWVACSGDGGDVIAHLDRSDPPVGRCVRAGTL